MKLKIIILTLLALTFVSCTTKINPSKGHYRPHNVNLKAFEGNWELISKDPTLIYEILELRISNDTIYNRKYKLRTLSFNHNVYEDTIKFQIVDTNHLAYKYYHLVPFFPVFFRHIEFEKEYFLTKHDILIERDYEMQQGWFFFLFGGGRTFDNYYYYKRVE